MDINEQKTAEVELYYYYLLAVYQDPKHVLVHETLKMIGIDFGSLNNDFRFPKPLSDMLDKSGEAKDLFMQKRGEYEAKYGDFTDEMKDKLGYLQDNLDYLKNNLGYLKPNLETDMTAKTENNGEKLIDFLKRLREDVDKLNKAYEELYAKMETDR